MENIFDESRETTETRGKLTMENKIAAKYQVEKIYPTTKFIFALVLCLATFLLPFKGMGFYIVIINLFVAASSKKLKPFASLAGKTLLPIVGLMFVFQLFVTRGESMLFTVGPLTATLEGLDSAIGFSSNIAGIASSIMLFFQLTETHSIIKAMENANLPKNAIFVINSTLLFVPESSKLSKTIMEAQQSRGVETQGSVWIRMKSFIPMISPLVLSTISNNEEKVLTLESRGYSCKNRRTLMFPIVKSRQDKILELLLMVTLVAMVVGRLLVWN